MDLACVRTFNLPVWTCLDPDLLDHWSGPCPSVGLDLVSLYPGPGLSGQCLDPLCLNMSQVGLYGFCLSGPLSVCWHTLCLDSVCHDAIGLKLCLHSVSLDPAYHVLTLQAFIYGEPIL